MSQIASWNAPHRAEVPEWVPKLRGNIIAGAVAIALGFGGFLAWGYTVHLDSAAVASGSVVVDTRRKTVSHLEGGILQDLLVHEGQVVAAGQPLARLENIRAGSQLRQLQSQRVGLLARLARLDAEQEQAASISFPTELIESTDPFLQKIIRNEILLFERRKETLARTVEVQRKQIDVYAADAAGAAAQIVSNTRQQGLLGTQVASMQALVDQGYATRTQLVELQGRVSVLTGQAGELAGAKARAEQARAGAELEISRTETTWQSDVADAMQAAQIELSGLDDNISAAADVLRRVEITAPVAGVVTNIAVTTLGSVVVAGQPIMDVVPENDERIVEARIDPRDIDSVHVGAKVQVRLSAYGSRQIGMLEGELSYVAADKQVDERTSQPYYLVRATVSAEALAANPDVTLYPGTPADLLILNKPRLAIDYVLAPFSESLQKAFREN
ncbi:HlyD family type I secretion periplasmic adaptor subunit [uncultured Devosia sp.]|uniref:HlyD family type I secretion periplasmic adaptor subunit n=1 Tax=uncultured Devosia sp. TaxID=211434 RepID=UPI0035C99CCB